MERQDQVCANSGFKNVFKLILLIILGVVLLVYLLLLSTGNIGKEDTSLRKSSDPRKIKAAREKIKRILDRDSYGIVKSYEEKKTYLEIKVEKDSWKDLSSNKKRSFVEGLAHARAITGLRPEIKVVDSRSAVEYALFENNRVTFPELDF